MSATSRRTPLSPARVGLWVFLAAATLLFSAVLSAYVVRMGLGDWVPLHEPGLLWLNTVLLAAASLALELARRAGRRGDVPRLALGLAEALTLAFVAGQLLAWRQLVAAGIFLQTNPAASFFYLITALHAAHVLGGLIAGVRAGILVRRRAPGAGAAVALCASYWHYLLAVWLVLFALLLAS